MGKSLQTMRILWAKLSSSPALLWVMSETIALVGLVLGLQFSFGEPVLIPFFVLSLVLMLIRFPTERALIKQLEAAYGAKLLSA